MSSEPAKTPPGYRVILTHEQLVEQVRELHDQRAEDYCSVRDLSSRVGANHLATMHEVGVLAQMLGAFREETHHRLLSIEKLLGVLVEQGRARA